MLITFIFKIPIFLYKFVNKHTNCELNFLYEYFKFKSTIKTHHKNTLNRKTIPSFADIVIISITYINLYNKIYIFNVS